jgi:hypothetical protein
MPSKSSLSVIKEFITFIKRSFLKRFVACLHVPTATADGVSLPLVPDERGPASVWRKVLLGIAGLLLGLFVWSVAIIFLADNLW